MFTIETVDPGTPAADAVVRAYMADVVARYHGRPATPDEVDQALLDEPYDDLSGASGTFVIARHEGHAVACAGARVQGDVAELTKVFTLPGHRGRGVGTRLLEHLEATCRDRGVHTLRLDTRADLTEACALYERLGYLRVEAFNHERYSDRWYAKVLTAAAGGAAGGAAASRPARVRTAQDLIASTAPAPWLPTGGRADVVRSSSSPVPAAMVRLMVRRNSTVFCLPRDGSGALDLPTRIVPAEDRDGRDTAFRLATDVLGHGAGLAVLGFVRNTVPVDAAGYPWPVPVAHFVVWAADGTPVLDGAWLAFDDERLRERHWYALLGAAALP